MVRYSSSPTLNASDILLTTNTTCLNTTECREVLKHAPQFMTGTLIRVIVLSSIGIFAIIGNIATLISIRKKVCKTQSTVYWLIANLAVADIMVSFFCLIADAVWMYTVEWLAGNVVCKIIKFFQMFTLYLSTFILVVIALDRYFAVKCPFQKANSRERCKRSIIIVWILSALLSIPQVSAILDLRQVLTIICLINEFPE